ncbi:MAG: HAD family hydrolase [Anaerolineae bacterium]
MKLILFDIDGTLLHTDGLSKDLFFESISETFSVPINPGNIPWGGLTDKGIAEFALRESGVNQARIEAKLPDAFRLLGEKWANQGSVDHFTIYPEAVRFLQQLAAEPEIKLAILTANCQQGAEHKLRIADLEHHFDFLVTGDLVSDRDDLPPFAFNRAYAGSGHRFVAEDCIVIGDTPADIACAKAHGMQAVAVATGRYSREQLAEHQPDVLLSDLTPSVALSHLNY